jgi:hypothetical protein
MNIYLDDDTAERRLVSFLAQAGHRVVRPADVHQAGASDAQHLIHAMRHGLVLMTRNYEDLLDLHEVVHAAQGKHYGMLIIRFDNDPTRDMTPRHIVQALTTLEAARVPLVNQVYILNHWR